MIIYSALSILYVKFMVKTKFFLSGGGILIYSSSNLVLDRYYDNYNNLITEQVLANVNSEQS